MEPRDRQGIAQNQHLGAGPYRKSRATFSGPARAPARTRLAAGELATPGNRLAAGQAGPCEDPAGDVFLLRGGLNRKAAGHCVGRGAFERDGRRSWLN